MDAERAKQLIYDNLKELVIEIDELDKQPNTMEIVYKRTKAEAKVELLNKIIAGATDGRRTS